MTPRARAEIEDVPQDSPSLKPGVPSTVTKELGRALRIVIHNLDEYGEAHPSTIAQLRAASYTPEQILGDWFPPDPDKP